MSLIYYFFSRYFRNNFIAVDAQNKFLSRDRRQREREKELMEHCFVQRFSIVTCNIGGERGKKTRKFRVIIIILIINIINIIMFLFSFQYIHLSSLCSYF